MPEHATEDGDGGREGSKLRQPAFVAKAQVTRGFAIDVNAYFELAVIGVVVAGACVRNSDVGGDTREVDGNGGHGGVGGCITIYKII